MKYQSENDRLKLKAAVRDAVNLAGGTNAVAYATQLSASEISKYMSPSEARHMRIDAAVEVDLSIGTPVILRAMAEREGFKLEPILRASTEVPTLQEVGASLKEATDVFSVYVECAEDGELCKADRAKLKKEINESIAAQTALLRKIGC